jgi:prepilin-type processing-associated H-X9-DG protein
MVVEANSEVPWTKPEDLSFTPAGPLPALGSHHPGGENALYADGSVRFLRTSIPLHVLRALITRNGGEFVSADAY